MIPYRETTYRWSIIAAQLPGRTDNDIKNYWNTKLKKKLMGMVPSPHKNTHPKSTPCPSVLSVLDQTSSITSSPYSASSPTLSSTTISVYTCAENNYYTAPSLSVSAGYEPFSAVSSTLVNTCYSMQSHQGIQDSFPRLGGEASCSSSDGSSNNQISYGKETGHGYAVDFPNYLYNGFDANHQKMDCYSIDQTKAEGCYSEKAVDYGLEEIKQLIGTNLCNGFLVDEIKSEGKMAY